jgi:hypothetical protein
MKYATEMDSGAMIYSNISSFIKAGSHIQKLLGTDTHKYTDRKVIS